MLGDSRWSYLKGAENAQKLIPDLALVCRQIQPFGCTSYNNVSGVSSVNPSKQDCHCTLGHAACFCHTQTFPLDWLSVSSGPKPFATLDSRPSVQQLGPPWPQRAGDPRWGDETHSGPYFLNHFQRALPDSPPSCKVPSAHTCLSIYTDQQPKQHHSHLRSSQTTRRQLLTLDES